MEHFNAIMEDLFGKGNAPKVVPMYSDRQARSRTPQLWDCPNGKVVGYNPHKNSNGSWEVALYKPIRGIDRLERVYYREFKTRKAAKKRALQLFAKENPKWAAKHEWWLRQDGVIK